jgi:hypothetical protein
MAVFAIVGRQGLCLFAKRLERGRFTSPHTGGGFGLVKS